MSHLTWVRLAILVPGLLCGGLLLGSEASAAGTKACADDIAKFCPTIAPGALALMECLETHEAELSSACRTVEATMGGGKGERREQTRDMMRFRQVCLNDMAIFCADANPTQGGMRACLMAHEPALSVSCSESMKLLN